MKIGFETPHIDIMIKGICLDTWMCLSIGNGELESDNQGRSRDTSFSQETVTGKVQELLRIGNEPARCKVQDVRRFLTHLPFFLFFKTSLACVPPLGLSDLRACCG